MMVFFFHETNLTRVNQLMILLFLLVSPKIEARIETKSRSLFVAMFVQLLIASEMILK